MVNFRHFFTGIGAARIVHGWEVQKLLVLARLIVLGKAEEVVDHIKAFRLAMRPIKTGFLGHEDELFRHMVLGFVIY
jgi:hypothetical protein